MSYDDSNIYLETKGFVELLSIKNHHGFPLLANSRWSEGRNYILSFKLFTTVFLQMHRYLRLLRDIQIET